MAEKKTERTTHEVAEVVRESTQLITKTILAAQDRNLQFVQTTLTDAVELTQSHIEATRTLLHDVEPQLEAVQHLVPGMQTVRELLRAPLASYQKALEAVERSTQQSLETVEQAAKDVAQAPS